eukprot:gene16652-687_t
MTDKSSKNFTAGHAARMWEAWVRTDAHARPHYHRPLPVRGRALRAVWKAVADLATRPVAPGEDFNVGSGANPGFDQKKYSYGRCARGMQLLGSYRAVFSGWTRRPIWAAGAATDA